MALAGSCQACLRNKLPNKWRSDKPTIRSEEKVWKICFTLTCRICRILSSTGQFVAYILQTTAPTTSQSFTLSGYLPFLVLRIDLHTCDNDNIKQRDRRPRESTRSYGYQHQ